MKTTPRIVMTALLAAILAFPVFAQQNQQSDRRDGRHLGNLGRCLAIVDLDDTQKEQIRSIIEASAPAIKALHEELKANRIALKELLDSDDPEACSVGQAFLEIDASRQAIREEMEFLRDGVVGVLTPEQAAKLAGCLEALRSPDGAGGQDD